MTINKQDSITALYAALSGDKAITAGDLSYWNNFSDVVTVEAIDATMFNSNLGLNYDGMTTDEYVKATYATVLGRDVSTSTDQADIDGFAYWVNEIETGSVSKALLPIAFINGVADGSADADYINALTANVNANILNGETQYLTTAQDMLQGGEGNDTFNAYIFNNSDTAQSGDIIKGGNGADTLNADMGTSSNFAVTLATDSVENFAVRAQADNTTDAAQNNTQGTAAVEIDAERMVGTTRYESNNSRADVVIEDVRIADGEITKDITIAMVQTDPGTADFGVYFDQHSLRNAPTETSGAGLDLKVLDITNGILNNNPLEKNPFNKVLFAIGGNDIVLELNADNIRGTYTQLKDEINTALVQWNVDHPVSAGNPDLSTITATITGTFEGVASGLGGTSAGQTTTGQTITLNTTDDRLFTANGWASSAVLPSDAEFVASQTDADPTASTFLITSTILLDDVGRGSMAGDLIVGGLSTGATSDSMGVEQFNITVERNSELQEIQSTHNTLQEVYIVNGTTKGNLVVAGDTNGDNLLPGTDADNFGFTDVRVLDASAMTGSVNLNAGLSSAVTAKYMNSADTTNTSAADNVEFMYKLGTSNDTLTLGIDSANLAAAGTTTREDFNLTIDGNAGNDTISTQITNFTTGVASSTALNWYTNSTSNANLAVNGGAGNDTINTLAGGNFVINAGSGNDTVYTDNAGTLAGLILADSDGDGLVTGADAVAGSSKATYVVNATNAVITDLIGATAATTAATDMLLYKSTVTVTYTGGTTGNTSGVIDGVANAGTTGFESTVTIDTNNYIGDRSNVNQAIKAAINEDAVLSKLLVATDGPENSLVITSLVDGTFADTDLNIQVKDMGATAFAALTAGELAGLDTAWETLNANSTIAAVALGDLTAAATDANSMNGLDTNENGVGDAGESILATDVAATALVGAISTFDSDNKIDLGSGDDVVVLGTDATSNDSIVFTGTSIGNNTVYNFNNTAAATMLDTLDFTAYLTNKVSASGSTESEIRVATTGDNTGVAAHTTAANEVITINDWTQDATVGIDETWANMTAAKVKAALDSGNAGADDYGTAALTDATIDLAANGTLVGNSQEQILMIENDLNQGEYKVFEMTGDNTTLDYTTVTLLGTVDFGATVDASVAAALV